MQLAGRPFEKVVPEIDVDELLNEEHPLHAYVEMRAEEEIPDLDPDDRPVQECAEDVELEEHVPRYASVPKRGQRPELRRTATVQDTRLSSSQPEFRRSTSQLDLKRKKDKGKKKVKSNKERRTEEPRRKSQEAAEYSPEESQETHIGEPFYEAPPLLPHLARLYEAEEKHYQPDPGSARLHWSRPDPRIRPDESGSAGSDSPSRPDSAIHGHTCKQSRKDDKTSSDLGWQHRNRGMNWEIPDSGRFA
ncbi:hypothetical protein Taro_012175 [Colocasia esculenta]|uniref:Uncharacterized protein n=1 Tax=Colocasia esculenta TaxID=4460 RepID=A0A843U822_COLES|nr:hypothetical protein [Colocasia esculenta]